MEIELGPELERFREEIRTWIAEHRNDDQYYLERAHLY